MSNVDESPFNLVCLVCGKMITAEIVDENHPRTMEQLVEGANDSGFLPLDAIEMTSYGHYGTTFFDPCDDGTQVAALICDKCMKERSDRLMHIDTERRLIPFNVTMKSLRKSS